MEPQEQWAAVDRYFAELLLGADEVLDQVLRACAKAGLPTGNVSPAQGKLLELLARVQGAQRILELGTLGAYSTIWLARALPPGGRLVTLESNPENAKVALANIANAGFADVVELRLGAALQTLPELVAQGQGPFDLIFLDADKRNNPGYFEWALKLSRPGTLIVADNLVRGGMILDPNAQDAQLGDGGIQALRHFNELIAAEPRVSATAIQTVGTKGYDGFALVLVQA